VGPGLLKKGVDGMKNKGICAGGNWGAGGGGLPVSAGHFGLFFGEALPQWGFKGIPRFQLKRPKGPRGNQKKKRRIQGPRGFPNGGLLGQPFPMSVAFHRFFGGGPPGGAAENKSPIRDAGARSPPLFGGGGGEQGCWSRGDVLGKKKPKVFWGPLQERRLLFVGGGVQPRLVFQDDKFERGRLPEVRFSGSVSPRES